jgi:hypothetical protein
MIDFVTLDMIHLLPVLIDMCNRQRDVGRGFRPAVLTAALRRAALRASMAFTVRRHPGEQATGC